MAKANGEHPTSSEIMESERARLTTRRDELQTELTTLEAELRAVQAYLDAKAGKLPASTSTRAPRASGGPRAARGSVQSTVLEVITSAGPDGIAPKDITAKVGVASQSVSNALSALKKGNKVAALDGKYRAA